MVRAFFLDKSLPFSGAAMTSERILRGHLIERSVYPSHAFTGIHSQRTSKPEINNNGFCELTTTIVWQPMIDPGCDPHEFVLWNIFPWHPYELEKGLLSNRTPTDKELKFGLPGIGKDIGIF